MKNILLIDAEDGHLLNEYTWYVASDGYVVADTGNRKDGTRKILRLHRLVMGATAGQIVDHVNRDKLDCRKSNLRFANNSTNGMNRSVQANSKSGIKGVSWSKQKNKWRITCSVMGRQHHLGYAKNIDEARLKYAQKIKKYHGEFSCV